MQAAATVREAITEIGAGNDIKQSARRAIIGIVVDNEQVAVLIEALPKRVPASFRELLQASAVGIATIDAPAVAAGDRRAVRADEFPGSAEVFALAEVDSPL